MHNKLLLVITLFTSVYSTNSLYSQKKNAPINSFIEKKREHNKISKTGFSVLLYNGDEEQALKIYNSFNDDYKNIEIKLRYISPNWKVMTNPYSTKIEAERIYLIVKEKHPNSKIL